MARLPRSASRPGRAESDLKHMLYENSVQSTENSLGFYDMMFRELRGREAQRLREDFCGTFLVAAAWVASRPDRTALALDLDPVPLDYGRRMHAAALTPGERGRLHVRRADVLSVSRPPADILVAENYSFYVFGDEATLDRYLRAARRSLAPDGVVVLDMGGGAGFLEKRRDRRSYPLPEEIREGSERFQYIWDQRGFDPVTARASYAIHFRFPGGRLLRDAFTYDWRIWTIPEVRRAMADAGFRKSVVYWEQADGDGDGTGTYRIAERADDDWSWNAYVVGLR